MIQMKRFDWVGITAFAVLWLLLLVDLCGWRLASDGPVWIALLFSLGALASCFAGVRTLGPGPLVAAGFVLFCLLAGLWAYAPAQAFAEETKLLAAFAVFVITWRLCHLRPERVRILLACIEGYLAVSALLSLETATSRTLLRPVIDAMATDNPELAAAFGTWTGARLTTLSNPNAAAPLALVGLLLAAYFFVSGDQSERFGRAMRWVQLGLGTLFGFEFALCNSLGTFIVAVPVLALVILLTNPGPSRPGRGPADARRRYAWALGVPLAAGVIAALPVFIFAAAPEAVSNVDKAATAGERFAFYGDALRIAGESPIFGQGLGAFELRELQVQDVFRESKYVHSAYLQVLDETGAVGLILFAGFLVLTVMAWWRLRSTQPALATIALPAVLLLAGHAAIDFDLSFLPNLTVLFALAAAGFAGAGEEGARNRPKWLSGVVAGGVLLVGVGLTGGRLAADQVMSGLEDSAELTLESLTSAVDTATTLDPLHRLDYWTSYVEVAGAEADPSYPEKLRPFTDRSMAACETLMNYALENDDLETALSYIEAMPKTRPLDPQAKQTALGYAQQLLPMVSGDPQATAAVEATIDSLQEG
jgi:O-antigen ligase